MRSPLQLVGRFESGLSLPLVNRELAKVAFRSQRFSTVALYSSDHVGIFQDRAKWGLYRGLPRGVAVELLTSPSTIGHAFGHPTNFHSWLAGYARKVGGLLTEQDFVPPDLVANANMMDKLWAPSRYVAGVYAKEGVRKPIEVFGHGIDPEVFYVDPDAKRNERFTFLHITGPYFRRKGTLELLDAWEMADLDADLLLIAPTIEKALPKNVRHYWPNEPLGSEAVAALLRKVHAYVAPSRGEGYGMIPCEARACGTPVLLTNATGHMDHFRRAVDVEIETGPVDWVPGDFEGVGVSYRGRVPTVSPDSVVAALKRTFDQWETLHAKLLAELASRPEPTWSEQLAPWARWLASS